MDINGVFRMPLLRRLIESSHRPAVLDSQEPRKPSRRSPKDQRGVVIDARHLIRGWSSGSVKQNTPMRALAQGRSACIGIMLPLEYL